MHRWTGMPRATRWVVRILRPVLQISMRRDWRGADRLPPGGYVLAPNHLSHLDPLTIAHFMVDQGVAPRFLAKDTLMAAPVIGSILRSAEQIPVHRSTASAAESLSRAQAAVAAGQVVTIYPEGTITRDPDLWPMTGRTGAVRVALATGRPLVPVAQWGPQEILWPYTKRLRLFPRKTVHVLVGEPVNLAEYAGKPLTEDLLHAATEKLMDDLTDLLATIRGERPTGPRLDVHSLGPSRNTIDRQEP